MNKRNKNEDPSVKKDGSGKKESGHKGATDPQKKRAKSETLESAETLTNRDKKVTNEDEKITNKEEGTGTKNDATTGKNTAAEKELKSGGENEDNEQISDESKDGESGKLGNKIHNSTPNDEIMPM